MIFPAWGQRNDSTAHIRREDLTEHLRHECSTEQFTADRTLTSQQPRSPPNVQRNRAATLRFDFRFRRIRRSGSRNCSPHSRVGRIREILQPREAF